MEISNAAEAISLALTAPTLYLARRTIAKFWRLAWGTLATPANQRTDYQWLILGIVVGFLGALLDNLYWGIAWTASYIDSPATAFWFEHGVFANVPFRQLAGIAAGYCHVISAEKHYHNRTPVITRTLFSLLLGAVYVWLLA